MENATEITDKIVDLLNASQITSASHQKGVSQLKKLSDSVNPDLFFNSLRKSLARILLMEHKQRNLYVDRCMDFFGLFCATLKPIELENQHEGTDDEPDFVEHTLLSKIFDFLLDSQNVVKDVTRYRACQLISKVLDHLVGMELSDQLCRHIEESLLERLSDPKNVIRLQAVMSLYRLQDPANKDDTIINEFVRLIQSDPFAKVRQICVERVAVRRDVLSCILGRISDTDVNVRLAAYSRLTKFAKCLKISERRHILQSGFFDVSEKITSYVTSKFIPAWLEIYDDNILEFLKSVRYDADEKDINETANIYENLLNALFTAKNLNDLSNVLNVNENKLIPHQDLYFELMGYWRIYVEYLRKKDELEDEVNLILPELVYFCRYIKIYYENISKDLTTAQFLEHQFIIKQMFLIVKTYDFSDIASRQCLNRLVADILEKAVLTAEVTEVIVSCLECSINNVEARSRFVNEIISEIMYPMNTEESQKIEEERHFQVSRIKVKLNCLVEDQKKSIEDEDFLEAARLKNEISDLNITLKNLQKSYEQPQQLKKRTDAPSMLKCLNIAAALLLSRQVTELTSSLRSLNTDVIQDLLIYDNDHVRAKALHCYSLCCIVDKKSAYDGIHIFSTPIFAYKSGEECDTQTLLVCMGAAVDLLRIYGSKLIAEPDEDGSESRDEEHLRIFAGGTSLTDLIQGLVDLMDDEIMDVQERAVCGLCSLVLDRRVHSPTLISRLVLKWCSPASGGKLKQMIGYTLQHTPFLQDSSEQLEGAVLITVNALMYAPQTSPLCDVNVENIAKFILTLCRTSPEGQQIHKNLAMKICCQLKDNPKKRLEQLYSKMLLMLDIPNDKYVIRDLVKLCNGIRDDAHNRAVINNIIKFQSHLKDKHLNEEATIMEDVNEEMEDEDATFNNSRSV